VAKDNGRYGVVCNEEQPFLQLGWREMGVTGTRAEGLEHIDRV
jgi:uncharacterized protein YbdZ (MbtH family)